MAAHLAARALELRERAAAFAIELHARARTETTVACERAVLRLFGVNGLDASGRPLALEVVERLAALGPGRLGGGIALPFAAAAREYDLSPQELALDVAAGNVDLGLEADLLREPERRQEAESTVGAWLAGAWERFDANRTARTELLAVLGDPPAPWFSVELPSLTAAAAAAGANVLVAGGVDAVRVRVPRDRELRRGLGEEFDVADAGEDALAAPAGSQRGLGALRSALDEAAAEGGRYVRLGTRSLGLAAPDQAVVAGFERVDLVFADPVETVVEFGVEPARAFADHAFAVEVLTRSGASLVLGPGPLAVAPELTRGEPLDPATRIGRALALQALSLELTRQGGLPDERILLGALSRDQLAEPVGLLPGIVEVALRRLVFPGHGLVVEEPDEADADAAWPVALTAWLAAGPAPALVVRRPATGAVAGASREVRTAVEAAAGLAAARTMGLLHGEAAALAERSLRVAIDTIRELADEGWEHLLLSPAALARRPEPTEGWIGAGGRVAKREHLDLLGLGADATLAP
jgi:beta-lysine 5,6-aminomutase alpha subunit